MRRKDCDNLTPPIRRRPRGRSTGGLRAALGSLAGILATTVAVEAGSLRMLSTAVVNDDVLRVGDVCDLRGFGVEESRMIREIVIGEGPQPGSTQHIELSRVRRALEAAGVNPATVNVGGAIRCSVSRPALPVGHAAELKISGAASPDGASTVEGANATRKDGDRPQSLREAVLAHFHAEYARYGGRADLVFDRTTEQMLDLSGPTFQFRVRRQSDQLLGLIQIEVDVVNNDRVVQSVPLVVRAAMIRREVLARRSINQGATIEAADVELVAVSVTQLDKLGLTDTARAIGQRSKQFVPAGTPIDPNALESVPLVTRGQLVTLAAVSGRVRVTSSGAAAEDGFLGDVIRVRASDNRRVEFEARVVGPGRVQIGEGPTNTAANDRLAERSGP